MRYDFSARTSQSRRNQSYLVVGFTDEAVREALLAIGEAADRICGKRLRIVMSDYVQSLERHGHLKLNPELREKLLI